MRAGETLTATTEGIEDEDGMTDAVFAYQWVRVDPNTSTETDIAGATGSTYTVTAADAGKGIKVRVTFTDDGGNDELLTSNATTGITATGLYVRFAALDGDTLTLNFNATLDEGVTLPLTAFSVSVNGIAQTPSAVSVSADTITLTLSTPAVAGDTVTVAYTKPEGPEFIRDNQGRSADSFTGRAVANSTASSGARGDEDSEEPENSPATGSPTISGTPQAGQTLTASTSGISDTDGLAKVSYTYQWISNDGTTDTNIAAATASAYTLVAGDVGKTIKVKVSFTDEAGNDETLVSVPTTPVLHPPFTASAHSAPESHDGSTEFTFEVGFSEEPKEGFSYSTLRNHALTVTGGQVSKVSRLAPPSNARWQITVTPGSDDDVATLLPITTDCTADSAICTDDDRKLSNRLELTINGPEPENNEAENDEPVTTNNDATGAPTISGTAQVGQTLSADTSDIADDNGLTNVSYSHQWLSDDTNIQDATDSTYTLADGDVGNSIKVNVSFTDDDGNEETLTSASTAAVTATVPVAPGSLSVSVNDTGKLDLSWSAPDSDGGSAVTGYKVQWKEASGSWNTPADVSETTVTGTSHTVSNLTDGLEYTFRVYAVNSAGTGSPSGEESGTPRETTAPTVSSATVDGATLTLTFSEGLTETPLPAVTTFTVNVAQNGRSVNAVAISGSAVTLTLASAVTSADAVTISYAVPSDAAAARLKDLSDNSATSFSGQAVANNTAAVQTPLTASSHDEATSHDGQAEFTFELRFSENLKGFSYKTLLDHAFTVTGGEVKRVHRLASGSNIRWEIAVSPDGDGTVTIVLPVTTDCAADGAVCTGDGRKLSNRLELTISGPTG